MFENNWFQNLIFIDIKHYKIRIKYILLNTLYPHILKLEFSKKRFIIYSEIMFKKLAYNYLTYIIIYALHIWLIILLFVYF